MPRKRYTPEQIICSLREAEIKLAQGKTMAQATKELSITPQTLTRWRKQYGGMKIDQAKEFKNLKDENTKLKKLVADLSLEKLVLNEALKGNY